VSRPLIVLRPEPGNTATTARARKVGIETHAVPLFNVEAIAWSADAPARYVGVLLTSANAIRHAGPKLQSYLHLPAFAVGEATATEARAAGFLSVVAGKGDIARLIAHISTLGLHRLLHLSGEQVTPFDAMGLEIDRHVVYRSVAVACPPPLTQLTAHAPVALLHSARAAVRFSQLIDTGTRSTIVLIAISAAVAAAASDGWEKVAVADEPRDEAMLEIAARLCR
jgi:uroporphyrinogen-III synthase